VRRWDEVEVETFLLRQSYMYEGTAVQIEAPTTVMWRREGDAWKIALFHSVPLPAAT